MYKELTKLLLKYDPIFKNHMECGPRNAFYSSNRIQNDIILAIYNHFHRKLSVILQTKKFQL